MQSTTTQINIKGDMMKKIFLTILFVAVAGLAIGQTVTQTIAVLQNRINLDNDQIGNDNAQINQYEGQIATINSAIAGLQSDILTQQTEIGAAEDYINELNNSINGT